MKTENADLSSLRIDKTKRGADHNNGRRNPLITPVIWIVVIALLGYFGNIGYQKLFFKPVDVELVEAALRSPSEQQSILAASGYIVAQQKAAVASKATGLMVQLNVKEGDAVKRGEVLARLEDNDIRAGLAEANAGLSAAKADLSEAEKNFARQQKLARQGSNTELDLERAETILSKANAAVEMASARVTAATVALENTIIRAPFDGTVLTKNADVGEIVAPFAAGASARAAVVTIADLGSLQVEADVSESNIEKISLDAPCEIKLDAYPMQAYPGHVASIIPTADRSKGTVLVKVAFDSYDARVLPEMSAKVSFLRSKEAEATPKPPVLTLADPAIVQRGGREVVFRVEGGNAAEVPVQTGIKFNGFTEIRNGLKPGDRVIRNIPDDLAPGTKVRIK